MLLTLSASALAYAMKSHWLPPLTEFQAILGIFLSFVPVGYQFTSALFSKDQLSFPEKTALTLFSSYAMISTTYFASSLFLGLSFSFKNSLLTVNLLALFFYAAYLLRFHLKSLPIPAKLRSALGE